MTIQKPVAGPTAVAITQVRLPEAFAKKYRLVRCLGAGAAGTVYLAHELAGGAHVAVKVLDQPGDPDTLARFLREGRLLAELAHPHIVAVREALAMEGRPALVTEYMAGGSLRQRLAHGALPAHEALAVMRDVLAGLAHCHARGVVHRDLKPENVLVGEDGRARLADFGLARGGVSNLTAAGVVMGTPRYMAPEQLRGEPAGPPADVHAAASLFVELATGAPAFPAQELGALIASKAKPAPPALPEGLAAYAPVIERALAPAAASRPTAAELVAAFGTAPAVRSDTDEELMTRAAQGDASAFAEVVRRNHTVAWRIAYAFLGDVADAEDVAQLAFLKVLQSLSAYRATARFTTFLRVVVVRLCRDHAAKRPPLLGARVSDAPAPVSTLGARLVRSERRREVRDALAQLPDHQRQALVLKYTEGLSTRDVAEALALTPKAVERLLARARVNLAALLGGAP